MVTLKRFKVKPEPIQAETCDALAAMTGSGKDESGSALGRGLGWGLSGALGRGLGWGLSGALGRGLSGGLGWGLSGALGWGLSGALGRGLGGALGRGPGVSEGRGGGRGGIRRRDGRRVDWRGPNGACR
jgi:hypothetical protein